MTMMMMMDIHVADTITVTAAKGLGGVSKLLLRRCQSESNLSVIDSFAQQSSSSPPPNGVFQISAAILPVDAVAPPSVKSTRVPRRTLLRRKRRTKRKLLGDDSGDAGDEGFFFGDGGNGFFGGGGGGFGGSGGGWNFNNFGNGHNWDESSSSLPDPAFDFVYQVLSWIMLWNCLHFAFKKIERIIAGGIVDDADRVKVPRKLAPIC